MADKLPTTPFGADEPPHHTPMSDAFPALLDAFAAMITSERDLEDIGHSQDPAYATWLREAELDQERLTDALRHFHALPCLIPADRPLQRMACLMDVILGHEEPGGARDLLRAMQIAFVDIFQVHGIGATAVHRDAMLIQAGHLVTAFVELQLFDTTPEVVCDDRSNDAFGIAC